MTERQDFEKKKLLFVINGLGVGGAERQTIDLVNNLSRDKFEIGLVYLYPADDLLHRLDTTKLTGFSYLQRRGKLDPRIIAKLARIIQEGKFETVICVDEYPLLNAYLCKLITHGNFSLTTVLHHTVIEPGAWKWIKNKIYQRLLNKCDSVVFVSENQQEHWIKKYRIHRCISSYIHNGIDVEIFVDNYSNAEKKTIRAKFGFQPDDFVFGICARLDSYKNHEDFIEAIYLANKRKPQVKGLIIGDGGQKNKLQKIIKKYSIETVISFAGYHEDVRPYIAVCDCMVITSHTVETFSMATLESMAMKKPMIMTDIGGASEQISHDVTGYLYKPGDVDKLTDYMCRISDTSISRKMGMDAACRVRNCFTLKQMVDKYERLFIN